MSLSGYSSQPTAATLAVAIGLAALAFASPAAGAPRDAITDPNSPSGTEYDLPADRARDETDGSGDGRSGGGGGPFASGGGRPAGGGSTAGGGNDAGASPPLFGVGIRSVGANGGAGDADQSTGARGSNDRRDRRGPAGGGQRRSRDRRAGDKEATGGIPRALSRDGAAILPNAIGTSGAGGLEGVPGGLAGVIAAVLLVGGLLGLTLRRFSRSSTTL